MPIFEYVCKDCGTAFEAIVANDAADVHCRKCQGQHLQKQLSTFAVSAAGASPGSDSAPGPCGSCDAARQGMCQMMN